MSPATQSTAGLLLVLVPTVAYGGATLLKFLGRSSPGYMDNPVRRGLFTAGHAHAGVLLMLALVALLYVESAGLGEVAESISRTSITIAPILMPLGFFLSVASPRATRPNRFIYLTYIGGVALAVGTVILGAGLLT